MIHPTKHLTKPQAAFIETYLATGCIEDDYTVWGNNYFDAARLSEVTAIEALVKAVQARAGSRSTPTLPLNDEVAFVRKKIEPLVNGLFPKMERPNVIALLEKSVVFVTTDRIESILRSDCSMDTRWHIANLYLRSLNIEPFSREGLAVGLNENAICYVSQVYFAEDNKFADYIVHEAAHSFHNCRRDRIGLEILRSRDHLLDIAFCERETFAYACEVYSRILELSKTPAERVALAKEAIANFVPPCEKVNIEKLHLALTEASKARNGWKRILEICASEVKKKRSKPLVA